jgi:Tfp pilus assembly protein PilN
MKAVNLLPSDLRGAGTPSSAAVASGDQAAGRLGAFAVLGVLGFCVLALAAYVLTANTVKDRQAKLAQVTAQTAATSAQAARLKPYADFQTAAQSRVQTVKDLSAARFDWDRALRDISRAIPADVTLTTLNASISSGSGGTGDSFRSAISAPAVSLQGCTSGQRAVADLLARLHDVRGVTRVTLSHSERADTTTSSGAQGASVACRGKQPPSFSVVAFFERADVPATVADVSVGTTAGTAGTTGTAASGTAATTATATTTSSTTPAASTPATTTP